MKLTVLLVLALVAYGSGAVQTALSVVSSTDNALQRGPDFDQWQRLLVPAPVAISLLGEMVVLASKVDSPLSPPRGGWKYTNHPESLRASLLQIGNEGWNSFRVAQRNMDEIQLTMDTVPKHIKAALRIIEKMPPEVVAKLITPALDRIGNSFDRCQTLADQTTDVFVAVMSLIDEIEEAVAEQTGVTDTEIRRNNASLEMAAAKKLKFQEMEKLSKERYDKIEKEMQEARKAYEDAVHDIPTGWKAVAMNLANAVVGIVKEVGEIFVKKWAAGGGGDVWSNDAKSPVNKEEQNKMMDDVTNLAYAKKTQESLLSKLPGYVDQLFSGKSDAGFFQTLAFSSDALLNSIKGSAETDLKKQITDIYQNAKRLSDEVLSGIKSAKNFTQEVVKQFKNEAEGLVAGGQELVSAAAKSGMSLDGAVGSAGSGDGNFENEYFKVKVRQQQLKDAQQREEASFNQLMAIEKELAEVAGEFAKLQIQAVTLQDILRLLKQVIKLLAQMQEQWSLLVQYFQEVATRAKWLNNDYVKPFIADTSATAEILTEEIRQVIVDEIKLQASDVEMAAFYLQQTGATYVKISSQYLLGPLAGLGKMLAAENDAQREALRQQLYSDRDEARRQVIDEISKVRATYQQELAARQQALEAYANSLEIDNAKKAETQKRIEAGEKMAINININNNNH